MNKTALYILLIFAMSTLTGSCNSDKDNSLYFPDFEWNTDEDDGTDPATETSMRVATYNIQVQTGAGWDGRKAQLAQLFIDYDFEICGIEEASWVQRSYLGSQLSSQYDIVAYGRDTGGDDSSAGEMTGILYKKNRFTLLESGRFWYSETPEVPSNGWDETGFKRFCVWGKFKDAKTQKEFYLFKNHMPLADNARKKACEMLVQAVSDMIKDATPAFCMGDFNADPSAEEIVSITKSGVLKDSYREVSDPKGALYTFPSKKTRIDYIFVKDVEVLSTRTIASTLSDHYPVVIVAEL